VYVVTRARKRKRELFLGFNGRLALVLIRIIFLAVLVENRGYIGVVEGRIVRIILIRIKENFRYSE
jgi:hypothetical protein